MASICKQTGSPRFENKAAPLALFFYSCDTLLPSPICRPDLQVGHWITRPMECGRSLDPAEFNSMALSTTTGVPA
jgi:hypothetical protein